MSNKRAHIFHNWFAVYLPGQARSTAVAGAEEKSARASDRNFLNVGYFETVIC